MEEEVNLLENFSWTENPTNFTGRREDFQAEAGPTIAAQSAYSIFTSYWDRPTMEYIATQTNLYAWQNIAQCYEDGENIPPSSRMHGWRETNVDELYVFFSVLMYMALCYRSKLDEYWTTGRLGMSKFREIMSRNRFEIIMQFLHFIDNTSIIEHGYARRLAKINPLLDIMNRKFSELYIPSQHISIDESLLLWKGRLSWVQCIRTKAARFGIKFYELCESTTGYLYRFIIYIGKGSTEDEAPLHGFKSSTAKIVLQLMRGLFDKGYTLFMDNFYNNLSLTRYLKSRNTDVVGTLNRRRKNVPHVIKDVQEKRMNRGEVINRNCGDISVTAWKDVKLVTMISTYHGNDMVMGQRGGESYLKPVVIRDYNSFMGGVDLNDQQCSTYLMERKRGMKWYIKVFRKLLNSSILNSLIIYRSNNPSNPIKHRQFRILLAEELINHHHRKNLAHNAANLDVSEHRLDGNHHYMYEYELVGGPRRRRRCARCCARHKKKLVSTYCKKCDIALCMGQCFEDYHRLQNL